MSQTDDVLDLHSLLNVVYKSRMLKSTQHVQALFSSAKILSCHMSVEPAPRTTLVMPLHMVNAPSVDAIRDTAWVIPVYTADGVGLTTCIRVYHQLHHTRVSRTLIASIGYTIVCSAIPAIAPASNCTRTDVVGRDS